MDRDRQQASQYSGLISTEHETPVLKRTGMLSGVPERADAFMRKKACDIEDYDFAASAADQVRDQVKGRHGTPAGDPVAIFTKPLLAVHLTWP